MQAELRNSRNFYKNGKYFVLWNNERTCWCLGDLDDTSNLGFTHSKFGEIVKYPHQAGGWRWKIRNSILAQDWQFPHSKGFGVKIGKYV